MVVKVFVRGIRGEELLIDLCENEEQFKTITVRQLRKKIETVIPEFGYFEKDRVQLIFTDKALDDDSSFLTEYGIRHMSVIHAVLKIPGGGGPLLPKGDGGMGDKDDKHRTSMERLATM